MAFQPHATYRALIPITLLIIMAGAGAYQLRMIGVNTGYAPAQPIDFSHALHAGEQQIPCQYCHSDAAKGRHASIPSMNVCMNCHQVVATDAPGVQKLREKYDAGETVEWVRVHDLPDHVYFSHRVHVAKNFALTPEEQKAIDRGDVERPKTGPSAALDCTECHGEVKTMATLRQAKSLEMGFCIDCHRQKKAPTECSTCHQ